MIQYLKHQKTALSERILDLTERLRHLEEGANVTVQSEVTTVKAVDTGLRDELIEVRVFFADLRLDPKINSLLRSSRKGSGSTRCSQSWLQPRPSWRRYGSQFQSFLSFWGKVFHRSFLFRLRSRNPTSRRRLSTQCCSSRRRKLHVNCTSRRPTRLSTNSGRRRTGSECILAGCLQSLRNITNDRNNHKRRKL